MMGNDTGVLIHGFHMQAPDFKHWEEVMWGKPPDLLGRIPKGVLVALDESARLMLVGDGVLGFDGKKSSEIALEYTLDRFLELEKFYAFKGVNLTEARKAVQRSLRPLLDSKRTVEEILHAGVIFHGASVQRMYLVSSPDHISRCIRDAWKIFSKDPELQYLCRNLFAAPSGVCFSAEGVEGVAIVEPSHLPDRPASNLNMLVQKVLDMPPKEQAGLVRQLKLLLDNSKEG